MVFSRRIRTLNDLAFLNILMMSSGEESEVSEEGDWGSVWTIGFDGAVSGAWANVVVKYTEQKDMKSKRENKTSFIFL